MRTSRFIADGPGLDAKSADDSVSQAFGDRSEGRIEIDVGMIAIDLGHRCLKRGQGVAPAVGQRVLPTCGIADLPLAIVVGGRHRSTR
jgi:hypothetical protein